MGWANALNQVKSTSNVPFCRTFPCCRFAQQAEAQDMLAKVLDQKSRSEQFTLTLKDSIVEGFATGG